jgi:cytoskeletal protein CcmA (bactofilin family)
MALRLSGTTFRSMGMFGKSREQLVIQTLIGAGSRLDGDLRFSGGCHVEGTIHGNVIAEQKGDAHLSISEAGCVEGAVHVSRVVIHGRVEGDVHASEKVELGATARIKGNVHYHVIEMVAGAEINGQLIHEVRPQAGEQRSRLAALQPQSQSQPRPVGDGQPAKQSG